MKINNRIIVLLLIILLTFNYSCSTKEKIRFDGVYQSETKDNFRDYYRFYSDGTVIQTNSRGNVTAVIKWLKKGKEVLHRGKYNIKFKKIYFYTTSSNGTCIYEGEIINENKIKLKIKSLMNGHEAEKMIYFIKVDS